MISIDEGWGGLRGEWREKRAVYGHWATGPVGWAPPLGGVILQKATVKLQCGDRPQGATADSRAGAWLARSQAGVREVRASVKGCSREVKRRKGRMIW